MFMCVNVFWPFWKLTFSEWALWPYVHVYDTQWHIKMANSPNVNFLSKRSKDIDHCLKKTIRYQLSIFPEFTFGIRLRDRLMVLNATFNNIWVIYQSWRSILLVEETRVLGKKNTDLSQVTDKLYHTVYCCIKYAYQWALSN